MPPPNKDTTAGLRLLNMADAGAFRAPKELLSLRARVQRLEGLQPEVVPIPVEVRGQIVKDVLTRTLSSDRVDLRGYGTRVNQAQDLERNRAAAESILHSAAEQAAAELVAAVRDDTEALQELLPSFEAAAQAFAGYEHVPDADLLRASDEVRAGALALDACGALVDGIWAARDLLAVHFGERAQVDTSNLFLMWSNAIAVWSLDFLRQRQLPSEKPWPTQPRRACLLFLATGRGGLARPQLWVPSAEQQDAQFRREMTDDVRQVLSGAVRASQVVHA